MHHPFERVRAEGGRLQIGQYKNVYKLKRVAGEEETHLTSEVEMSRYG